MRIALTYDFDTKEIGQHFGQTQHFLLVDIDGDERKEMIVTNGGYSHHELVGYLKDLDVEVLIAGGMGNHAITFLDEAGIKTYPGQFGDAHDVLESYLNGEIVEDRSNIHMCDCHDHHHDN